MAKLQTEEKVRYIQPANCSKMNTDSNYKHVNTIKVTNVTYFLLDLLTINVGVKTTF